VEFSIFSTKKHINNQPRRVIGSLRREDVYAESEEHLEEILSEIEDEGYEVQSILENRKAAPARQRRSRS
jgi:hypothetical protein